MALRNVLLAELDKNYGVEYIGGLATKEFVKITNRIQTKLYYLSPDGICFAIFVNMKHLVIVGGGIVGVATAYQVWMNYPKVKITIFEKE